MAGHFLFVLETKFVIDRKREVETIVPISLKSINAMNLF